MGAWLRELAGWLLLGVGLAIFAIVYAVFLLNRRVIEAFIFGVVGVMVFRGGLGLLKVAVAARAMGDVKREAAHLAAPRAKIRPRLGAATAAGRARASVLPGPSGE